jgi:bifunctional non-homologous end joining protein LigD
MLQRSPAPLPLVRAVLPVARREPFDSPAWLFEPKYDGVRGLIYASRSSCVMSSEPVLDFTGGRRLCEQIRQRLRVRDVIMDGEVLAVDPSGLPNFRGLRDYARGMAYVAFDLLWLDGRDLRDLSLTERKRRLERLIPDAPDLVMRSYAVEERGQELFDAVCRLNLAGMVAKRKVAPYCADTVWYHIENPTYAQTRGSELLISGGDTSPPRLHAACL